MKKIKTIFFMFMLILSCMLIQENTSFAATDYKDWSETSMLDKDYSYSTMFFSDTTEIQVLKSGANVEWSETNGIHIPSLKLENGEEAIVLITDCAIDKDNKRSDVVIKVDQVTKWIADWPQTPITITFRPFWFNHSQENPTRRDDSTTGTGYDYVRDIKRGELINFYLNAIFADCRFTMTYYLANTYTYNSWTGEESGTLANITSINNFVYDLDIEPERVDGNIKWWDKFLEGREGIRPNVGDSVIYYNKNHNNTSSHMLELAEIDGGIGCDRKDDFNTNGVWYKSAAFITTNNIANATYSFNYGGCSAGFWYSFMSPYPYSLGDLKKSVSKTKVKEQEGFTYTLSQYIPNNYYGSLINFSQIYTNLYGDTHYTKVQMGDILNNNLAINGNIYITNEKGVDRSSYFDINVTGNSINVNAKNDMFNEVDFYSHTYNVNIPVYIKAGTGPNLTNTNVIKNQGGSVIQMGDGYGLGATTNEVETSLYYDVTTSITNGSITQSSSVDIHNNKTITFRPNNGYYVSSVTINGQEQDISRYYNGGTINLSDVTRDYNIVVKTEAYGYTQITKKDTNTSENVQGAVIGLYYNSTCTQPVEGNTNLVTNASGTITSGQMRAGTYYVKEIQAPNGYTLNSVVQKIIIYSGRTTQVTVNNKPNTAQVNVAKLDNNTGKIITKENTTFALYEWNTSSNTWVKPTHINTGTTNGTVGDGKGAILKEKTEGTKGTYTATMYYNVKNQGKFRIVEYTRPYGYTTSNWAKEIQITQDGQIFSYLSEVKNTQVRGQINFKKNDKDVNYKNASYHENFAQGDATLQGALYGLYAKEAIISPDDGRILYQAGQQIGTKTTDSNGKITWENLYLGKYYVQEITASKGYLKDSVQYEVDLNSYYNTNYFSKGDQATQNIVYRSTRNRFTI